MSVKLSDHLQAADFAYHLQEIASLLDRAQSEITFWGTRYIKIQDPKDPEAIEWVELESLAGRILDASWKRCDADDLTPQERLAGIRIMKHLNDAYESTDALLDMACIITWLFSVIFEFNCFIPYTTRFYIEEDFPGFTAFSETRFLEAFGGTTTCDHPDAYRWFSGPRVSATEPSIRSLLISV